MTLTVVVLVLCVVGFGFYRGWFSLSSPNTGGGSNKVSLTVEPDKLKATAMVKEKTIRPTSKVTAGAK